MGTDVLERIKIHHGHNIRRLRNEKKISQKDMAEKVFFSQQTVSRYESTRVIENSILERFAKALEVPVDMIKTLEEDNNINLYIENNTIAKGGNLNAFGEIDNENIFYPLEKIMELCNEKTELYERMLALEKEKISMLEQILKEKNIKSGKGK
ncbi:MAG: helix-turn-helix domain-containing protein [Tannerella sp.]|jgi:transcriptional regulator with XRE-family HTH domain|nr:helix-turn-helix domain-containing protein [Tannerella sp.]